VGRFTLSAPRRAARGAAVRVRIVDRWGLGAIAPQLCVTPPRGPRSCERASLDRAVTDGARVSCCGEPWATEYARRARLTMQAYARSGRVLWLTLPLPRDDRRREITSTVNRAIVEAAAGVARVRVLRMDVVFTPDGYREVIRYRGRDVDVRDVDGVHLNVAGTAIAAKIVADELRR
jgi:hypothetical protein